MTVQVGLVTTPTFFGDFANSVYDSRVQAAAQTRLQVREGAARMQPRPE
jgi:hypothetical protein